MFVYPLCAESIHGVEPFMIYRMMSTPFYQGCRESFQGVHPSMIHRMMSIDLNDSPHHVYTHAQGLRCILEGYRPINDSPHGVCTSLRGPR